MNWIYYLLEANFYLGVFYLLYYFMLRNETYYQFNRAYLLSICVAAFVIPLLQVGILKRPDTVVQQVAVVHVLMNNPAPNPAVISPPVTWTASDYYLAIYATITVVMALLFMLKIITLYNMVRKGKRMATGNFKLVEIDNHNAFSFFGYLFINPKLADTQTIVQHELVHIRQKHSLDILFLEFFKIINWFNPIVYLLQNNLKELHEFIADKETVNQQVDVGFYADFLLHNAYNFPATTLTNNFFSKNLLKRRIMMLYQKPSGSLAKLKYLLMLPVCAGLLCVSTLAFSKTYGWLDLMPNKPVGLKLAAVKTNPADSGRKVKKAKIMRFPPPIVVKNEYAGLYDFVTQTMQYPAKAKRSHEAGIVVVRFTLGADHLISDASVSQSAGYGFDEAALKAVQSYHQPIADAVGVHLLAVGFYSFYSSEQVTPSQATVNDPGYAGEVELFDEAPKTPKAAKGN